METVEHKPCKLLLINPSNLIIEGDFEFNRQVVFEPLGLEIVAAYTPENWEIEILDENFETIVFKKADLVGITAFTSNAPRAYEIAAMFRDKGITTVMGGIHASMLPEEAEKYVDSLVIGEAESVWPTVIKDFESKKLKRRYIGQLQEMETEKFPRRDLIKPRYLHASIQTTRGCPMDCDFCSVSAFNGRKYRLRPVDDILAEIEQISNRSIFFVDDNIVGHNKETQNHAMKLFKGMIERKLDKYWYSQASMNVADNPELLKLAAKSGCKMLLLGIETEKPEDLENMNKKLNLRIGVKNYSSIFRRIHRNGIAILGAFIFGMDSDTVEDLLKREKYIKRSGVDAMQTTLLTPYPGTRLYEKMKRENRLIKTNFPADWKYYRMLEPVIKPNHMTVEVFSETMAEIWKHLYSKNHLRLLFVKTFLRCWNINPVRWVKQGVNAAMWGFYTNHLTYKRGVEAYMKYLNERSSNPPKLKTQNPNSL